MRVKICVLLVLLAAIFINGCESNVNVEEQLVAISSLHVSPATASMPITSELQLYAIAVDESGDPRKVEAEWSVYGSGVTIDENGKLCSSSRSGSVSVYATYGGFQSYSYVEVKPGSLASISITPDSVVLGVGDSYVFSAAGRDTYGNAVDISPVWEVEGDVGSISDSYYEYTAQGIKFMSSSYSSAAYFTAENAGSGTIRVICGSMEASVPVEVVKYASYSYTAQWPVEISGEAMSPRGGELDADGNVWVSMYAYNYSGDGYGYSGYVAKYDASGNFIATLEGTASGEGQLIVPNDIVFDSNGNIYIVDYYGNKVFKYDSSGVFLLSWGGYGSGAGKFSYPARIAISQDDYIYVTDSYNDRVQKFDPEGNFILEWGSYGDDDGDFCYPAGIAVDAAGNVYVADQANYRIQKFSSSGAFITSWGSEGTAAGEFGSLVGLAIDAEDKIFAADYTNNRVLKYDGEGNLLARWGGSGSSAEKLNSPMDVAVDNSGNVYVVNTGNQKIKIYQP